MGLFGRFFAAVDPNGPASVTGDWLLQTFGGALSTSGERVGPETGMGLSVYYACIRNIAEDVGKLPFVVYKRLTPRGKERAPGHRLYRLLHDAPNPDMSSMAFRETLTGHALGWRGGFAEIVRDSLGRPVELAVIHPSRVTQSVTAEGRNTFRVRLDDMSGGVGFTYGGASFQTVEIPDRDMFHLHGFGPDGRMGYGLSNLAKESIGRGIATQKFASAFFAGGAAVGGVLEHPGKLPDQARANLRKEWAEVHSGAANAGKVAVLWEGMKFAATSVNPKDAQALEAQRFTVEDLARWFRMPPHKVQELSRGTFSNIEHQSIEYVVDCLGPWFRRWEHEAARKLFEPDDDHFAEHLIAGLLRGDSASRAAYYRQRFEMGTLSPNDIRELENENPIPGGDTYFVPGNNLVPLKTAATMTTPQPEASAPSSMPASERDTD